jgi:hypothetical protein
MIRRFALTIALLVASTHASRAQGAPVKASADSLEARFVGVWDGRFTTDHAAGGIQITVAKETAWKMSVEMSHGDQAFPVGTSDIKVSGKTISWTQDVMGSSCPATATVNGQNMTGEVSCSNMTIKLELEKKARTS